ncbi:MAG TPA: FHA domain-containing protein [Desulfobacterales bacterium]|nr:FHA domain-containing protein [Desulfobacterales bacterium]
MAETSEPVALIVGVDDKQLSARLPVGNSPFLIGRDEKNHLCLSGDRAVSRLHCAILVTTQGMVIEDLKSSNGTYVNGRRVTGVAPLSVPSLLTVGRTRLSLVPATADYDSSSFLANMYSTKGTVLIPPTQFFQARTEALLVVDLVGSSRLLKLGEIHLLKVLWMLGQMLDRSLRTEEQPFLKCTGDGFFACFGSAEGALKAAVTLAPSLKRHISTPVTISIALHFGPTRLAPNGERTGKNVHAVFSLEDLRHKQEKLRKYVASGRILELVLMTKAFLSQLPSQDKGKPVPLGFFGLKGLDEKEGIFLWDSR